MKNPILLMLKAKELNQQLQEMFNEMSVIDMEEFCSISISEEDADDEEKLRKFKQEAQNNLDSMCLDEIINKLEWLVEIDHNGCVTELNF